MKDKLNKEVKVGDRVAYAMREDSTRSVMALYTVLAVEENRITAHRDPDIKWNIHEYYYRKSTLTDSNRLLIINGI